MHYDLFFSGLQKGFVPYFLTGMKQLVKRTWSAQDEEALPLVIKQFMSVLVCKAIQINRQPKHKYDMGISTAD